MAHRKCSVISLLEGSWTDDQGERLFDPSKLLLSGLIRVGEGVAEGVLVYVGGESSIDSQGRCVESEDSGEADSDSPAKNHLFPTVSVVVATETETETEVVVAVNVEKMVVVTGSGVTEFASFRTAFSL